VSSRANSKPSSPAPDAEKDYVSTYPNHKMDYSDHDNQQKEVVDTGPGTTWLIEGDISGQDAASARIVLHTNGYAVLSRLL
jgi:hypothetical protein